MIKTVATLHTMSHILAKKHPTQKDPTQWHDWLGLLLLECLTRFALEVELNFSVTTLPSKGDILIRRSTPFWSAEQQKYLPDGLRHSLAPINICDLKYTQSVNEDSFFQIGYYNSRYRKNQKLKKSDVQSFLLSAKTPQKSRLARWGYQVTEHAGVYRSSYPLLDLIPIISLNELSAEPHNALVKCFASLPKERQYGLRTLRELDISKSFSPELSRFLTGLWVQWLLGEEMKIELTTEQVMEIGELWGDVFLSNLPLEEYLSRHKPEEVFSYYKTEEYLSRHKPEEIFSHYKPEEVFSHYKPEEIEAYLAQLKAQNN